MASERSVGGAEQSKAVVLIGHSPISVFDSKVEAWEWVGTQDVLTDLQMEALLVKGDIPHADGCKLQTETDR